MRDIVLLFFIELRVVKRLFVARAFTLVQKEEHGKNDANDRESGYRRDKNDLSEIDCLSIVAVVFFGSEIFMGSLTFNSSLVLDLMVT